MPIARSKVALAGSVVGDAETADETYTPENDVTNTLADGRVELVAAKGVPIPLAEAKRRGLVKVATTVTPNGPSETKTKE